jgi:NAD(P)-dependent dehydrogenase (short-subunit alcohol dehydrogenase family)
MTLSSQRVAIVTGGSRGIGVAICGRLAADGMSIHLVYRSADDAARQAAAQIQSAGGRVFMHKADISSEVEVQSLIEDVVNQDATVHVLVNNAGIIDDRLLELTSLAQWENVLRVNLTGPFLMCRAVIPLMIDQGWGRIINISSNSARLPGAGQSAYAASKGGLEAFTRCLAVEAGRKGVRVNAVSPGAIKTDMTAALFDRLGSDGASLRWGLPEDISGIVGFLASDEADYIQGQTITADGGRLLMRQRTAKRKA